MPSLQQRIADMYRIAFAKYIKHSLIFHSDFRFKSTPKQKANAWVK